MPTAEEEEDDPSGKEVRVKAGNDKRPAEEVERAKSQIMGKVLSSKTTSTNLGFALSNVVPGLFKMLKGNAYKPLYTIEDIESRLYDIEHHDNNTWLLEEHDIIPVLEDEEDELQGRVRIGGRTIKVIRCFTDRRARYAADALLFSVLVTFAVTPLSFSYGGTWSTAMQLDGESSFFIMRAVLGLDVAMDFIYAGYLLLQLNMSFMHSRRRVEVTGRTKILQNWLWSPLYYVMWISTTTYIWIVAFDAPLFINNIKCVRVAHLLRFPDPLWLFEEMREVRLGRLLFLLVGCSHWVACVLFCSGGFLEELRTRGENAPLLRFNGQELENTGPLRVYLMAFVESVYMMTGALDNPLGDGMARENNLVSLIIVSVFGPVGMVIVAMIIASVVREQALQFALEIRHEENMAFVRRALENLNIPAELQRRVVSLHYFQKMSHDTEAFSQLFNSNNLSGPLEDAIRVYLFHKVLLNSPFFNDGGRNYMLAVVRVLEDRMYLPGDYVARRGEVGAEMFFISRGELRVLVPGNGADPDDIDKAVRLPHKKRKGDHFGEVALVQKTLRTAWVKAETYVIVSVLHRHHLEEIWEFFPAERERMVAQVGQTIAGDKKRAATKTLGKWTDTLKKVEAAASMKEKEDHPVGTGGAADSSGGTAADKPSHAPDSPGRAAPCPSQAAERTGSRCSDSPDSPDRAAAQVRRGSTLSCFAAPMGGPPLTTRASIMSARDSHISRCSLGRYPAPAPTAALLMAQSPMVAEQLESASAREGRLPEIMARQAEMTDSLRALHEKQHQSNSRLERLDSRLERYEKQQGDILKALEGIAAQLGESSKATRKSHSSHTGKSKKKPQQFALVSEVMLSEPKDASPAPAADKSVSVLEQALATMEDEEPDFGHKKGCYLPTVKE